MVIRTIKEYRDKNTKEHFVLGSFREVSDERGKELVSKGLAVEYAPVLIDKKDESKTDKENETEEKSEEISETSEHSETENDEQPKPKNKGKGK